MVNGNDLLEFVQKNEDSLEQEFLLMFDFKELKEFIFESADRLEDFKRSYQESWDKHCFDEFSEVAGR